jgi:hypothetical protein
MRSRAARLTFGAVAWIIFGAAAFFLIHSEQQIVQARSRMQAFDLHARETTDRLADLQASQQAYVAAGQGIAFWIPRVAATSDALAASLAALRESAASSAAIASIDDASKTMAEFGAADARAREYLKSGQELMAADVVFTEGRETARTAARQVETARLGERQAMDAFESIIRKQQAIALLAAVLVGALVILLLAAFRPAAAQTAPAGGATLDDIESAAPPRKAAEGLSMREPPPPPAPAAAPRQESALLASAAALCTDFGRVRDRDELTALLGRAADVMEATGVVVWLGNLAGGDLQPVLAHGYSPEAIARMPAVRRSANNAAAAAYRMGSLQLVLGRPGGSNGAIVAPLLAADGCIGALSVEIRGGGETSDSNQALAGIFAAQLAAVLFASAAADDETTSSAQAAAQG